GATASASCSRTRTSDRARARRRPRCRSGSVATRSSPIAGSTAVPAGARPTSSAPTARGLQMLQLLARRGAAPPLLEKPALHVLPPAVQRRGAVEALHLHDRGMPIHPHYVDRPR